MTGSTTSLRTIAEVALGRQRAPQHDTGPNMVPYLRAANVKNGSLDLADVKEMNFTPKEQQIFSLRPGDVLVTEGSGSLNAVGASSVWSGELSGTVCFQNTLLRLRPRGDTDSRFLSWWARYAHADGLFASMATGANIYHLSAERVRALPCSAPPAAEQRRIADFLDAETARIDSLAAARQKMASLLALKRERLIESNLQLDSIIHEVNVSPLKYLAAEVMVGIVITPAKWYVTNGGVPALRGTNVRPGRISADNLVKISNAGHLENRKSRLRSGDLVVVRTGQAGAAAVVPSALEGANCIDLIIVRPGPALSPRYLEYVLNSGYARRHVEEYSTGSIQAHFNVGAMKQIPIPSIPRHHQDGLVAVIDDAVARIDSLSERIQDQATLLLERRQALITAAVTGQFDVSTASGLDVRRLRRG